MDGYWIVLSGMGGELDRRFVKDENTLSQEVANFALQCVISPGDTIRIEEGWSEG